MKKLASMEVRRCVVDPDLMFIINSDRACYNDQLLQQKIMYKGLIQTQTTIYWMQMLADEEIVGNYIQTTNARKLIEYGFRDESAIGAVIATKSCIPLPLDCIIRGYYVPKSNWWKNHKTTDLSKGLQPYQQLSEPIYTPFSTKDGVYVTFEETVKILKDFLENVFVLEEGSNSEEIAAALATEVKEKAISAYKFAHNYAIQKDIIIADANLTFGLLQHSAPELVLIGNTFTPDSSRIWDAKNYKLGEEQYSMGDYNLRKYLSTSPETIHTIPERILKNVSESYIDVFQRLFDENVIRISENCLWSWKKALESIEDEASHRKFLKEIQSYYESQTPDK